MAFSYTNRKGTTYYLHRTATRHGKHRYYFARQLGDAAVEELPEGYEVRESVNGQVSVALQKPRVISQAEEDAARSLLGRLRPECRLEVKDRDLVAYEPWRTAAEIEQSLRGTGLTVGVSTARLRQLVEEAASRERFEPVLRFTVVDEQTRRFEVRRMTYRGEGGWSFPLGSGTLADLVRDFVPRIGTDDFFELI